MSSSFQNRLVGTVILVALAIIIVPDVLDGKKQRNDDRQETIPLKPNTDLTMQNPQLAGEQNISDDNSATSESTTETVTKTADEAQPIAADNTLQAPPRTPSEATVSGDAWVIQLGAFSQKGSVDKLVQQLQDKGFAAYAEPAGNLTKLMVGPDTSEAALKKQLTQLEKLTGLKGQVLSFEPGDQ
ncbi:SPOR domain-containing protein [Idiomarina tyrosinivorans]|uniref:SPOR domain-containing protein n=1 Tax=Idiomarina tyrosinivorans TaxID=1445662 RepID=A0A432ZP91_9GAMM|nr:SPOR domain-containing protein [Idiomarina tyrosinivorans]RUO79710.1 SPOR domain-containing protein [Idiomarina tyrosinivorans]